MATLVFGVGYLCSGLPFVDASVGGLLIEAMGFQVPLAEYFLIVLIQRGGTGMKSGLSKQMAVQWLYTSSLVLFVPIYSAISLQFPKPCLSSHKIVLLQPLEHEQFLVGSPLDLEQRVIQFVDHMVFFRELFQHREASSAVVVFLHQYLRMLGDVLLAGVALDLVGGM